MEKYSKVKVLGKGSFGCATLIKRKSDGQLFVVKEINMGRMSQKEKEEARNECKVLQQLQHPNIVQFLEQIEKKGILYIIMEYADGGDLNQKIEAAKKARVALKEELVLHYFAQLCLALDYMHSKHILHRDIKAMNVFLTSSGVVKLGDFGISTILRNTLALATTVCGTPYYFSPELCRNKPYNNKSDVWALGIILYEMLTLKHAFDGNSMDQLLQRIVKTTHPPLPSHVSGPVREIVNMCLHKDPNRRPTIKHLLALDVMRTALAKLQGDLVLAEQAHRPLKDIVADPVIEDEAEKVRKAKLAGARAAAAVLSPTPAPPLNPFGVPGPYHVGGAQRQQLLEKAIDQNNKVPKAAPMLQQGKLGAGGPIRPQEMREELAKVNEFIARLERPTHEIMRDAVREAQEKQRAERANRVKELDAQLHLEMEKKEKERIGIEKERNRAAIQKHREQQAELERMANHNREKMLQCREQDRLRREEQKRQLEAREKKKEQEIAQAKEAGKPKPSQFQQHGVNAPLPALQPKPRSPPPGTEVAVAPQKVQPLPRRPAPGGQPPLQPVQQPAGVAALEKEKERQQVQNWANRNNDVKRRELEAARQKKLEEDRLAVLAMDNQVYKAQQHAGGAEMKKKVLDPDLDRWVAQQERLNKEKERLSKPQGKQLTDEDVRKSIDAIDRILKEQRGEVPPTRKPHTPRLAANACGSPQSHSSNVPAMQDRPLGRYLAGAQPNPNVALFPPINPREREIEPIGMRRAYSHENPMPAAQPSNGRWQPPIQPQPLLPSFDPDRVPLPKPRVPTPPVQDIDTIPTPFRPQPKLQNSVGGHHQRSRSDITDLERHQEEHQRLVNPSMRPLRERRVSGPGFQRLALKAEDIVIRRDTSAPPVMRTPKKHVDAGALELEAVTKMEEVPTPVRQWMEPIGEGSGSASSSAGGPGSNNAGTKPSTNNTTSSASSSPPSAGHTLTPVHSNVPKKRLPPPAVREDTPIEEEEGLAQEGSQADVGSGGFDEDSRSEPEEVVEESILEAATSQSALAARSVQYNLMRSHIASLLGSPVRASQEGPFGRPPEAQVALHAGVIFEPVTPEPRKSPAAVEGDESGEGETDEDFEDAEAITPSQFRQVVSSNVDDEEQDDTPDDADCAVADEEAGNEEVVVSDADGNHEILDATETALFRVAALCGENFNGTQPCHTDGKPLFEGGAQTGSTSKAEALRDYLEKEMGLETLTAMYKSISELLTTRPPVPPTEPKNSGSGRSASTGSNQQDSYTVEEKIIRKVTAMVVQELGPDRATEPVVDDLVSLVAQLVYLDTEVFA